MATTYRSNQGEMLDLICYRHYGPKSGIVEHVLDVNVGLADLPGELPLGTVVQLPDAPAETRPAATIKLWD